MNQRRPENQGLPDRQRHRNVLDRLGINPADIDLFGHVTVGTGTWDGHDTEEKYARLDAHTRAL